LYLTDKFANRGKPPRHHNHPLASVTLPGCENGAWRYFFNVGGNDVTNKVTYHVVAA
jgi:hypothetical protein